MSAAEPQSLAEMLTRYLQRQAAAHADGMGPPAVSGEIVPHEAAPVPPAEPRLAWKEALAALDFFGAAWEKKACVAPPDWAALAAAQEPVTALPLCVGNYPQMVRDLHGLLHAADSAAQPEAAARPLSIPATSEWATAAVRGKSYPKTLLALAALRLARQYDEAEALANESQAVCPSEWQAALANERAALAWHRGRREEADGLWRSQPDSAPVLFNRGVAAVFLGRSAEARTSLAQAVGRLPEESGWHHLGRLYLALAEMRG